jgi:hypothetical protein
LNSQLKRTWTVRNVYHAIESRNGGKQPCFERMWWWWRRKFRHKLHQWYRWFMFHAGGIKRRTNVRAERGSVHNRTWRSDNVARNQR